MRAPSADEPRESLVLLVSSCRFAEAIAVGMLVPILPVFLSDLSTPGADRVSAWIHERLPWLERWAPSIVSHTDESRTALLFFLTGMAMAASQVFAGRLSDRLDARKPFILVGMLGGAICSSIFATLDTFQGLLATRVAQGLCLGLTFPPMMAIVARHSPPGRGGRTLGLYTTVRLAGFALGPVVGGAVASIGGHRSAFFASALLLLVSVGLVGWLVPDPREHARDGLAPRPPRPPVPWVFRLLGGCIFVMMIGISAIISLFPAYRSELGATEWDLGLVFGAFIATRSLLQWPAGWLGDRFDKKRVLVIALAAFAPIVALQAYADSIAELVALRAGLGVASAAISASVAGISAERSLPGNRARVMGLNTMSFSLGTSLGPLFTGLIPDREVAFAIPAGISLLWVAVIAIALEGDRALRQLASRGSTPVDPSAQSTAPA